ncbi:putative conserved hypothetical protein [Colletotrichum sublineola]|uniref:Uncharacterized protein n=1 Tax=Colletotrichum sublineola TaxID=1173701 RepID=A0A066XIC0_COLSU|nr:putative conserved hypothetical protein [Colletotrichum sublineola]
MLESSFTQVNRRLEEERRAKFCGTASISISSLRPTLRATNRVRRPVPEPLKRLYREEHGCRQEDNRHHAKATISQDDFALALANAGISAERLQSDALPYSRLEFPPEVQLECLQGTDRIMAADEVFDGMNKRWIVDLFLDDLSDELKTFFVEEYEYQKEPEDGEFYCKIRRYQGHHGDENPFFERIWLGRLSALSNHRRSRWNQLFRHKKYSDAFDALLAIPALFCGFRLSVFHEVISMRCDEPNLHYLKHILNVWTDICGGDRQTMRLIDRQSIERLQGTAPGAFSTDHDELLSHVKSGHILGNFPEEQRDEIWVRICNVSQQRLIPSLFTFFEDRKFLSTAADCMRRLTGVSSKVTVLSRLDEMFQDTNQQADQCIVQVSQTAYVTVPGDEATRFDLGSRQLWLAAFRDFRELPADVRKKDVLAKARKRADETTLFEFASLANRLGFESNDLSTILKASPDFEVAKRLLLCARKPEQYRYPDFEKCLQKVTEIIATAQPVFPAEAHSSEMNEACVEAPIRCGIPRDSHHDRDQPKLFLPNILSAPETGQARITSFFIRRSVYLSYFGLPQSLADFVVGQQSTRHLDLGNRGANSAERMDLDSEAHTNAAAQTNEQSKLDHLRELSRKEQDKLNHLQQLAKEEQERLHQLTQEQSKLDQLRELVRKEQDKLDHLRQLAKEEQERLHQFSKSVHNAANEADFLQNQIITEVPEESNQHSSGMELVLFNTMNSRREASLVGEVEIRPPKENNPHPAKRTRRITRFDFDRVKGKTVPDEDSNSGVASSTKQKITIEFFARQGTGRWVLSDEIEVYASDPSTVERTAKKYLRKNFLLYDISGNYLNARTCFNQVTANHTNRIMVAHKDQPFDYEEEL